MIKALNALFLTIVFAGIAYGDQYGGFQQYADRGSLEPFCRDLGGVLGSATYHGGRSLGFSGFDAGVRYGGQFKPDKNNKILRGKGVKIFGIPWLQAELGLPFRLDGFVRGFSFEGLTIVGGGMRFGLLEVNDKPWAPQLLVSGVTHAVVHQHFSANHQGASLVFSMGIPIFNPYIGAGFDRATLVARSSTADPTINGTQVTTTESRGSVGIRSKPFQFFYISLAYSLMHGRSGGEGGLGIRF